MTGNPLRRILLALTCASAALAGRLRLRHHRRSLPADPGAVGGRQLQRPGPGRQALHRQRRHHQHLEPAAGRRFRICRWWRRTRAVFPMPAVTRWCQGPTGNSIEAQVTELLSKNTLQSGRPGADQRGHRRYRDQRWRPPASRPRPTANVQAAGTALGAQVQRLVNAGAKHVLLVVGMYPLGPIRPMEHASSGQVHQSSPTSRWSFNNALKLSVVDLGYERAVPGFVQLLRQRSTTPPPTTRR
jgi:hypothetical protein